MTTLPDIAGAIGLLGRTLGEVQGLIQVPVVEAGHSRPAGQPPSLRPAVVQFVRDVLGIGAEAPGARLVVQVEGQPAGEVEGLDGKLTEGLPDRVGLRAVKKLPDDHDVRRDRADQAKVRHGTFALLLKVTDGRPEVLQGVAIDLVGVCEGAFGSLAELWRETGQERPSRHGRSRGGEIAKVLPAVHADSHGRQRSHKQLECRSSADGSLAVPGGVGVGQQDAVALVRLDGSGFPSADRPLDALQRGAGHPIEVEIGRKLSGEASKNLREVELRPAATFPKLCEPTAPDG